MDYKSAGVDINAAHSFKKSLKNIVRGSLGPQVLKSVGGFGGLYRFSGKGMRDPVLVSSADGVGTKLKIAAAVNRHATVGIDAVAMNVNDILCTGASTLFFLDYIAFSSLPRQTLVDIVKGLNEGCMQAGCALIGGETAQMPGMYKAGEYDLAGFCVGAVDRDKIVDGSAIRPGDAVIGLASNGIHSNGYSLVRAVFSQAEIKRMAGELLKPTKIYVKPVLAVLDEFNNKKRLIRGISHITGGAFYDKISRILPADIDVRINRSAWEVPPIFKLIQFKGRISDEEMYHTLNMGIGMALVVDQSIAGHVIEALSGLKIRSWVIGDAVKGNKKVEIL
ncbi:MAG TPA: phosphoribosylformylglycinamidine cyclo-ligase [Candidatus Omnitrophota bacterium]|nr:phosphoribosylformylglycinamidine cyclo-ligase [Candidatus Omnitrophota bacterium]HNQ50421.1 phosphoribosylformylglycinamidine cyclo-ligase [Candidatus Omnitrophota bacterium]HQO37435.1 phosphoribosylformylglycinamidine cyclo-ligase [Candidatus Omnitrophota bacterium]HQQ05688.1 phosphoribosylformylglycinamidine cyclo-ligase [Candidatus Omnitrophota bacterium]